MAGEPAEDPQDEDPELEEDIELVLWRLEGIPWLSLLFTIYTRTRIEITITES